MTDSRDFIRQNARELERLRVLVGRLTDEELASQVNESWTVAGVLGHAAFWDTRAKFLADKLISGVPFSLLDDEPEDVDWINDSTRPLIHAIPPRALAELSVRIAEETDAQMATLPPELAAKGSPFDPASPLILVRAGHRREHLDEIEASLST